MKIAIQGQAGSFHDAVARRFFADQSIKLICCDTFPEVFEAVASNQVSHAVCAVENSLYGPIADVYDLLLQHRLSIIGEVIEHIHQNLIGLRDTRLADITEVYSHPVALNQCRSWLEDNLPDAEIIEHHDTAGAVAHIKELDSTQAVAIASEQASILYDLPILERDIEDEKTNLTRFFILSPDAPIIKDANRASLVLITPHSPGALYRALGVFDKHQINLTKLTSRPIRGEKFRYQFFVDADCDGATLQTVIDQLSQQKCSVTLLGHYIGND